MFGFLKDKLKQVVSVFSKKVEQEAKPIEEEPPKEPPKKEEKREEAREAKKEQPKPAPKEAPKQETRPEPRPEIKPEPKPEPKPELKKELPKEEPKRTHEPEERPAPKEEPKKQESPKKEVSKPAPVIPPKEEAMQEPEKAKAEEPHPPKNEPAARPAPDEKKEEKHGFFDFLKKKEHEHKETKLEAKPAAPIIHEKPHEEKPAHIPKEEIKDHKAEEPHTEPEKEKRNIFDLVKEKITKQVINERQFEEMFSDLEMALLENSVALEVIDKIKEDLRKELVDKPLERGKVEIIIESSLKKTIEELFDIDRIDLLARINEKKPYVICFVGINGSGKTTTIAKLAHLLKKQGKSSVMAAGDTFRAAAIQQLEEHAVKLNIKLIKHDYGADSAAVAFDAISHAKAHNIDVVLIDTAGRLHSNANLMDEIKKVKRVTKPDLILFVGESITGNDCVEQAKTFDQELGIDGIILSKSDVDEKGGAAISISYVTKKPIMYLGTGQGYDDIVEFDPKLIIKSLGLEA